MISGTYSFKSVSNLKLLAKYYPLNLLVIIQYVHIDLCHVLPILREDNNNMMCARMYTYYYYLKQTAMAYNVLRI